MDTILITGGTGTFGNSFTEHVLSNSLASRVIIFSRDEKKQQEMRARFADPRLRFFLGNVRDQKRLERAFQGVDVVVNAASLKQIQRSGEAADEFFKTICIGALNVINAAHVARVKKVVALSTDKSPEATTPYGAFKLASEFLFIGANAWGPKTRFSCTRYGNVLDSRGSVLEIWRNRIAAGLLPQVTDPMMTRFWMSIDEAVRLVLLAIERMRGGEIFVPKNVKCGSVVDLLHEYHPGIDYEVIGKRSYEKHTEVLVANEERDRTRDCGDVYVIEPLHVRWEPGPWGVDCPLVAPNFQYRSDGGRYNG